MSHLEEETIDKSKIAAIKQALCANKCVKEDNLPIQIEEGLFLGSFGAAINKDALKSLNITHILTVADFMRSVYPDDFVYKKIKDVELIWFAVIEVVADREQTYIARHFDECFSFIDEAKKMGGGVLVHCFAGRSR
ncbi:hypothetical protein GIB67_017749, partial [Kingdonia uniflora]